MRRYHFAGGADRPGFFFHYPNTHGPRNPSWLMVDARAGTGYVRAATLSGRCTTSDAAISSLKKKEINMAKRTEKRQDARSFSFRLPREVFDDLEAVAKAR